MIIIFGERFLGKVHQVPGICHVTTKFVHLYYLPLVPFGSYIVLECVGEAPSGQFHGMRTSFSLLSILMGYFRAYCGLLLLVFSVLAFVIPITSDDKEWAFGTQSQLGSAALAVGLALLFALSRWLSRASQAKTVELLGKLGLEVRSEEKVAEEIENYDRYQNE